MCTDARGRADYSSRRPAHPRGESAGSLAPELRLLDWSFACLPDRTTVPGRCGLVNRGDMTITHLLNVDRRDTKNGALVTLAGEIDRDSAPWCANR